MPTVIPQMPRKLVPLLLLLLTFVEENEPQTRDIDALELFSGKRAITRAAQAQGLAAMGFDSA